MSTKNSTTGLLDNQVWKDLEEDSRAGATPASGLYSIIRDRTIELDNFQNYSDSEA